MEALDKSGSERDVAIVLAFKTNGVEIEMDTVKLTCVMINLGNVVCRENNMAGLSERGHSSLVTHYTGSCISTDLSDPDKYKLTEVYGLGSGVVHNDQVLTSASDASDGSEYQGCYTNTTTIANNLNGYTARLKILHTASYFLGRSAAIWYCGFDMFESYEEWNWQTDPTEEVWRGTLADVKCMRCDGFVEVVYEMNGVMAWGRKNPDGNYGYDIRYWDATNKYYNVKQHNVYTAGDDPEDGDDDFWAWSAPITQCGNADAYIAAHYPPYTSGDFNYTANNFRGTFWQTQLQPQRMAYPISLSPETHP